jgi:hypothetical protein
VGRRGGDGGEQALGGEGPEEAHLDQAHLIAARDQMLHRLLGGAEPRTHEQQDPLRVRGADILEGPVVAAGEGGEAVHDPLDDGRQGLIVGVDGLASLEVNVGVLGGAAQDRMIRVQGPLPVGPHQVVVDQGADRLDGQAFDLIDLVGGAETVKKVDEGHPSRQGRRLGDEGEVHDLLHRGRAEHGKAGGPAGHDVGVIAEDGEGLGG